MDRISSAKACISIFTLLGIYLVWTYLGQTVNLRLLQFQNNSELNKQSLAITSQKLQFRQSEVIHLVSPITGTVATKMAMTMLKSIFYQLGRYLPSKEQCPPLAIYPRNRDVNSSVEIHYHIITDDKTKRLLQLELRDWSVSGLHAYYYDINRLYAKTSQFKNMHYAGTSGLSKIWFPDILPAYLKRVMGMVEEQCKYYWNSFGKYYLQDFPYGYNSGLILMDLEKARRLDWSIFVNRSIKQELKETILPTADQDILNSIAHENKGLLHILPCKWNMVVNFEGLPRCNCTAVRFAFSEETARLHNCELSAIHFNERNKPEYLYRSGNMINLDESLSVPTSGDQFRTMYKALYMIFRSIKYSCIV